MGRIDFEGIMLAAFIFCVCLALVAGQVVCILGVFESITK